MTDASELSDLRLSASRNGGPGGSGNIEGGAIEPDLPPHVERDRIQAHELDRLHRALAGVTPETHPRTARLLASSTRKAAQKVIEEAGEVAIDAVRRNAGGIVRESADLLYHLVALWHRAGVEPQRVWSEMRRRADMLGIAEKLPKKTAKYRQRAATACGACRPRNPAK